MTVTHRPPSASEVAQARALLTSSTIPLPARMRLLELLDRLSVDRDRWRGRAEAAPTIATGVSISTLEALPITEGLTYEGLYGSDDPEMEQIPEVRPQGRVELLRDDFTRR